LPRSHVRAERNNLVSECDLVAAAKKLKRRIGCAAHLS
jgi:hypothetical protein